jgi:hypothetical protein
VLPEAAHIERMIRRAPGCMGPLIHVAWLTGCRLDELAGAERAKLDHNRRQLTVRGKRNKTRVVDLDFGGAYDVIPQAAGAAGLQVAVLARRRRAVSQSLEPLRGPRPRPACARDRG